MERMHCIRYLRQVGRTLDQHRIYLFSWLLANLTEPNAGAHPPGLKPPIPALGPFEEDPLAYLGCDAAPRTVPPHSPL